MRTDQLIRALAADHGIPAATVRAHLGVAVGAGLAIGALLFALLLGPRPDFAAAVAEPRFIFKFVVVLTLAAIAAALVLRLAQPGTGTGLWKLALLAVPALLACGVTAELAVIPASSWITKLIGTNWRYCLTYIPLLAAPFLVAALIALRHGAPTRPAVTGAIAGLLAGGLGAALYAGHCTDDSPLFVATWYSIAIAGVTIIGAIAGNRLLRW
jgi:hypothetical protein